MGLLDTTMEMAKLAGKIANPELIREVTKANIEALELSRENIELQRKITALEAQLREIQKEQDLTTQVFTNTGYVFLESDPNAHCARCWDAGRKLIHLHPVPFKGMTCPECKTQYARQLPVDPKRDDPDSTPAC